MTLAPTTHDIQLQKYLSDYGILTNLPCGIVILNAQGLIVWFNSVAEELLGRLIIEMSWLDVIEQAFSPKDDDGHEVSLADGRRVSVAISSLESIPGEVVMLTDLTTTRHYEQSQADHQRLVSIGKMTAQLAHQIRTPLTSAMIYVDHLLTQGFDHKKALHWLNRIKDCHESMEQQVKDLLLFARGSQVIPTIVNLYQWGLRLTHRAQTLVAASDITLTITNQFPAHDYRLYDESLTGAVLNLVINAVQAKASYIAILMDYKKLEGYQIQVTDNGCGMTEAIKAQLFTPFFTTKAQGTGLGLAVVNAVVGSHNGNITITSSPGNGCCVTIKFQ
jgi:two-component system sensor histidine kinase FlrB